MRRNKITKGTGHTVIEALETRQLLTVTLDPIGEVTYPGGRSIFVPITGATAGGTKLNWQVSTSSSQISARVLQNITFIDLTVTVGGVAQAPMRLALFHDIAPNTVTRFIELVNSGFFVGKPFHRIIGDNPNTPAYDPFMAQGGGTTGTNIDDEFHPDAIFDAPGLLAMANANQGSTCDTNDAQFFITFAPTRWLDFRHTIFGKLVRGQATLDKLRSVGSASGTPTQQVTITSAAVVQDLGDTVLMVKGPAGVQGAVGVTAQGSDGSASMTFNVNGQWDVGADGSLYNSSPFLAPVQEPSILTWQRATIAPRAIDVEGDPAHFEAVVADDNANDIALTRVRDKFTITPLNGFSGTAYVLFGVQQASAWDTQWVAIHVTNPLQIDPADRTLHISGTEGNDKISLSARGGILSVKYNGHTERLALSDFDEIVVNLQGGNDSVTAATGVPPMIVYGGAGNDTIRGGSSNDTLFGEAGNDSVRGNAGNDSIDGGTGDDRIGGDAGDDRLLGGDGVDLMQGGLGNDSIEGGHAADKLSGGAGDDTINAGDGDDTIAGDAGNDQLSGSTGNDSIRGGAGDDRLLGEDGTDLLRGDAGNDSIDGGAGADTAYGGSGNDTIVGGAGSDSIFGDAGNDYLYLVDDSALFTDTVDGGKGMDQAAKDDVDVLKNVEDFSLI